MNFDFDLFVIGAGSGGVRASRVAAQLGAKVAVAEDHYLGGTCVNVGCVPKKLFVYASEYSKAVKDAQGFGWQTQDVQFDWASLRDNKTKEITRLNGVYDTLLRGAGVTVLSGHATIEGPQQVSVGGRSYRAKTILIASGGWPRQPDFPGAQFTFNSNDVFSLESLPRRILVQGGGYIAVEFAGIFNGLGCATELVYRGELFLRGFDREVREFVAKEVRNSGVEVSFDTDIAAIEKCADGSLQVTLTSGATRIVDGVFTAIGRDPKIAGLGLENTAVTLDAKGFIAVDDHFRTQQASIFALGDVVGRMPLTPVALAEGMALARYLFAGEPIALDYSNIATAVFCQPNIATLGITEDQAKERGMAFEVFTSEFRPLKNTVSGSTQRTLMKLLVDIPSQRVVGIHMVGPDAGEIIQGLAVAVKAGATKADFDATIGVHPTAAEEFVTMRQPTRRYP